MTTKNEPPQDSATIVTLNSARTQRKNIAHIPRPANDAPQPMLQLPPVTKALCAAFIAVFAVQQLLPDLRADQLVWLGGFVPARYTSALTFELAAWWSPLTHALLHGGWLHLGMNIGMLMAFGAGLEKQRGGKDLLIILIVSTLGGALAHFAFNSASTVPMIGASGGISGLFGAILVYMGSHAQDRPASWRTTLRNMAPLAAVWIGVSLFFGVMGMPGEDQSIAWAAHIGGFLTGIITSVIRMAPKRA